MDLFVSPCVYEPHHYPYTRFDWRPSANNIQIGSIHLYLKILDLIDVLQCHLQSLIKLKILVRDGVRGKFREGVDKKMPTRKQLIVCNTSLK